MGSEPEAQMTEPAGSGSARRMVRHTGRRCQWAARLNRPLLMPAQPEGDGRRRRQAPPLPRSSGAGRSSPDWATAESGGAPCANDDASRAVPGGPALAAVRLPQFSRFNRANPERSDSKGRSNTSRQGQRSPATVRTGRAGQRRQGLRSLQTLRTCP